jgi:predicted nucleic acid-binding Zn ribbon protein
MPTAKRCDLVLFWLLASGYYKYMSTFVPFPEERGVEPLKEVLSRVMIARGWGKVSAQARLEAAWKETVGPQWEAHTQALAIKRGILEVRVADAVVHQQLIMSKATLLQSMQLKLNQPIKDLKMRVG